MEQKWKRNCPKCGKELYYKTGGGLDSANKKNTVCRICRHKVYKPWNKGLTKETDERVLSHALKITGIKRGTTWNKGLTKETDSRMKKVSDSRKGQTP